MSAFKSIQGCINKDKIRETRLRGRPKRTWMEIVKIDLKTCNLSEDLAQDISEILNGEIEFLQPTPTQLRQGFDDDDG